METMESPVDATDKRLNRSSAEVGLHVGVKTDPLCTRPATDAAGEEICRGGTLFPPLFLYLNSDCSSC